ncbi:MAG: hypothetical protein GTN51_00620 [Armatimonadetes bacterium]|nr:hypothetical protein [Armatimonadota bacterium]
MGKLIRIIAGGVELEAELSETECAGAIYDALPIETAFNTWGDEFYFQIPVNRELDETATTSVKVGDIGYWPPGSALAIFYGRTPASTGDDPVPASEVNLVGRITGDAKRLKDAEGAGRIRIEKA